ncbi:MAG: radical SAM protein [bacterium]|nr:radical SAM protein [bacterium]
MVNISINSECNNNCKYCFQKDYHKLNKRLTYEDIEDILDWSKGSPRIAVLGGEPTLHPDIVKIMRRINDEYTSCIFSNFLCETEVLKELLKIPRMGWLINSTTTNENLKDLFEENMTYANEHLKIGKLSLGLTLIGEEEHDEKYIKNLVRLGKQYPNVVGHYRLGIATPFHNEKFKLLNFDKPIKRFYELSKEETPDISIGFDCTTNNCQISPRFLGELLEDERTTGLRFGCHQPIIDVMVDKSIKYCSSVPDDFIPIKNYRDFRNWEECYNWLTEFRNSYMQTNNYFCKTKQHCNNSICQGPCIAMTEHFIRQENAC